MAKTTKRTLPLLAAAIALLLSLPAFAQSLGDAKSQGLVGERPDGYVGAVKSLPSSVKSLVDDVNAQRRANYEDIARRQNTSRSAVEAVAGTRLQDMTAPGGFIQDTSGGWRRK
ncbi:MAG: YdbL family protein [Magnetospirillum sp. WYHS-4]